MVGCRIVVEGWSDLRSKKALKHILGSWLVKNFDGQPRVVLVATDKNVATHVCTRSIECEQNESENHVFCGSCVKKN